MKGTEGERIGVFPSWRWVYGTVIVWGIVVIVTLTILTRILGFGVDS